MRRLSTARGTQHHSGLDCREDSMKCKRDADAWLSICIRRRASLLSLKLASSNPSRRSQQSLRSLAQSSLKICWELPLRMLRKKLFQVWSHHREVWVFWLMFSRLIFQHTAPKQIQAQTMSSLPAPNLLDATLVLRVQARDRVVLQTLIRTKSLTLKSQLSDKLRQQAASDLKRIRPLTV